MQRTVRAQRRVQRGAESVVARVEFRALHHALAAAAVPQQRVRVLQSSSRPGRVGPQTSRPFGASPWGLKSASILLSISSNLKQVNAPLILGSNPDTEGL